MVFSTAATEEMQHGTFTKYVYYPGDQLMRIQLKGGRACGHRLLPMHRMVDSPAYRALKQYEHELIDCLQQEDILTSAGQAVECQLAPCKVKANLAALSSGVSSSSRCRYLFYNVYNSIVCETGEPNVNAYQHWLTLLSKRKVAFRISSLIKQYELARIEEQLSF